MKKLRNLIPLIMLGLALNNSYSLDFATKKKLINKDCIGLERIVNFPEDYEDKRLIEKIRLIGDYNEKEKEDIEYVLRNYENYIGDISKFNLEIEKIEHKPLKEYIDINSKYSPIEQAGYSFNAITDLKDGKIKIIPKDLIDKTYEWETINNKIPKGEEGKIHNFVWILAHEIAHAISIKLGYMNYLKEGNCSEKENSFVSYFSKLMDEINERCIPLSFKDYAGRKKARGISFSKSLFWKSGAIFKKSRSIC
jgi:hypothetical protein